VSKARFFSEGWGLAYLAAILVVGTGFVRGTSATHGGSTPISDSLTQKIEHVLDRMHVIKPKEVSKTNSGYEMVFSTMGIFATGSADLTPDAEKELWNFAKFLMSEGGGYQNFDRKPHGPQTGRAQQEKFRDQLGSQRRTLIPRCSGI